MSAYLKSSRGGVLASALLLAIAMAFCLAFAAPSVAQAEEADLQAGAMTTQAVPDAIDYTGDNVSFIKEDGGQFGMYKPSEDGDIDPKISVARSNGKILVVYYPNNTTTYTGMYLKAGISDKASWTDYHAITGKKFVLALDESYAGKAWPVAPVKSDMNSTTSTQYYLAIPALSKIPEATTLKVTNSEKMFVVTTAALIDNASGSDYLFFCLSGSSYTAAYAGAQGAAVAAKDAKAADASWCLQSGSVTFDPAVEYTKSDGTTGSSTKGYLYCVPVAANGTTLSADVVVTTETTKTGGETVENYHARHIDSDLSAKTLTVKNASDTADVTVTSAVSEIAAKTASLAYTGYVRPYAGAELDATNPLSNDWVGALTIGLGANSLYDKAYAVTYEGKPWVGESATEHAVAEADYATINADGELVLPIVNEYDTTPKTAQLNGNIIKVMMHVKADADVAKKDLWVERTFQLDFTSRTAATLKITGDSLGTPMVAPLADHSEGVTGDVPMEPKGYGLTVTPVEGTPNTYDVVFSGTGLEKHVNGQGTAGYWAGIAIPGVTGKKIAVGWGKYDATKADFSNDATGADAVRKADGTYTEGGFDDIWFPLTSAKRTAYVAVATNEQDADAVVYNLDFSKMTLDYEITAAETKNGTIKVDEKATEGDTVKVTVTPDEGYKLAKLSYSLPGGQLADITDKAEFQMPSGDTTVSATFEPITYQVTFESNGGSAVAAQTVNHGAKATKPADPTFKDHTFGGWYSDKNLKTAYDFTQAVTADTTLYAKWNVNGNVMYRLYNPNSGEHFFTSDEKEYKDVVAAGWNDEGTGWTAPVTSGTPVYRLYNKYGGEHHYTTSAEERDWLVGLGWNNEGIGWYSDDAQTTPLYRVYNPNKYANNHHYTTSAEERDWLVGLGWKNEGIGWYGLA